MKIELLYFDGCPSWEIALKNLETALQEENIIASIKTIKITDDEDATRLNFLGSPHFRVDGKDLWHEVRETFSMSCRVYSTPEGIKGFPTINMLREQLGSLAG
ncbi:MAG: thioredoxin family protein [Anaerolineae bacterium]|nr:thioredoxin family protein [Chloroflexota bacterium]MBN8582712.1 thioredoxin family protein [Anaerolineae bacterium]